MGTFVKDEKLTEASLGTKTVYKQNRTPENTQQYYLEGSENDGWKVIFSKFVSLHYFYRFKDAVSYGDLSFLC